MVHNRAGLEQVRTSAAAIGDREAGAAAGQRESRNRVWRKEIVRSHGSAEDAAGCGVRSQRGVAVGGLRAAEARGPHAPARLVGAWRLGEHRVGVTLGGVAAL